MMANCSTTNVKTQLLKPRVAETIGVEKRTTATITTTTAVVTATTTATATATATVPMYNSNNNSNSNSSNNNSSNNSSNNNKMTIRAAYVDGLPLLIVLWNGIEYILFNSDLIKRVLVFLPAGAARMHTQYRGLRYRRAKAIYQWIVYQ